MFEYSAKVVKVYDGDTITVDIDLGFEMIMKSQKIRLYGINTPEIRGGTAETKAAGRAARDWLKERILGKKIVLQTIQDKTGKYGRWLGEIYLINTGLGASLNERLVNAGLAERVKY